MSKKNVLMAGFVAVVVFIALALASAKLGLECSFWTETGSIEWCEPIAFGLLIPIMLLVPFSLLTYKLHDDVFRSWLHFAYWWMPLSIVITLILSVDSGGSGGMPNLLPAEGVAAFFGGIFFIVSLIIIIWKYFTTRRK